jgi:predicted hotdog family 3-hydroxylacyl-ACP dehydratase
VDLDFSAFDPSMALDAILFCDDREIVTRTHALPPYLALEAMAQTCGMHLRRRHDFKIQAYLVSLDDLVHVPETRTPSLTIRASMMAETKAGARYEVSVNDAPACRILIGRQANDRPDTFFRSRFACLSKASCSA